MFNEKLWDKKYFYPKKISDSNFEFIIEGIIEQSNNGFIIAIPVELNNNYFYLISPNLENIIRGGIGTCCQRIKLLNESCICYDKGWLGEEITSNSKYFSFKTLYDKLEIVPLNCFLDYNKFCNLINSNRLLK